MQSAAQSRPTMRVPFLDLRPSHKPLEAELVGDIAELIRTGAFTNGPQVAEFELAFAAFCGRQQCVGAASGLDALRLSLVACGLEPGDEVVVPANTFVASAEAVTQAGGIPVLTDVSETDYNLDPEATASAVGSKTRFLMPVHLYGQLADMRALGEIAGRKNVVVVEDACQAHGASRDGFVAGAAGTAAAFSFYPGKNLGAIGDAGALVTDSADVAKHVRALREHGQRIKYHHDMVGWTARLDTIQALALLHKLPHLPAWNEERRAAAVLYP
jgi:dTDP-4-amino-4,6-dideoxygalactose transaminase